MPYLVGKEGDSAPLRSEDGDNLIDERGVGVLLQIGLKTDIGAPLLGCYMYCEVCVLLDVRRKEINKKSGMAQADNKSTLVPRLHLKNQAARACS